MERKSAKQSQRARRQPRQTSTYTTSARSSASGSRSAYVSGTSRSTSHPKTDAVSRYQKMRLRRKRLSALKVIALIAVLVVVASGTVALAAYLYSGAININLQEGLDEDTQKILESAGELEDTDPFYMLLLGVDSSEERDASGVFDDTYRSDSIILARVDPGNKKVTLVSLHRDAYVDVPGWGMGKLNTAYAVGGASLMIQMVNELAGIEISHYAEVNFDALSAVVDALGGIEVDVPVEIDDNLAGGYLAAGYQTLNGAQTMILCRSRHTYDDYGDGDVYRAANQRQVLKAILAKVLSSDPATMVNIINLVSQYVTTDLSVSDIVSLGIAMMGMDTENDLYSAMMPTEGLYLDETWYETILEDSWNEMMTRVDAGLPPTEESIIDPYTGVILSEAGGDGVAESEDQGL